MNNSQLEYDLRQAALSDKYFDKENVKQLADYYNLDPYYIRVKILAIRAAEGSGVQ